MNLWKISMSISVRMESLSTGARQFELRFGKPLTSLMRLISAMDDLMRSSPTGGDFETGTSQRTTHGVILSATEIVSRYDSKNIEGG